MRVTGGWKRSQYQSSMTDIFCVHSDISAQYALCGGERVGFVLG